MEKEQFVKVQEDVAHHLTEGLHSLAVIMAEIIVENEPHAGKMLPKKAEKEKLAHSLEKELILFKKRFERGCHCLLLALNEAAKTHPEINHEDIAADFKKLQEALQSLEDEKSVGDVRGIGLLWAVEFSKTVTGVAALDDMLVCAAGVLTAFRRRSP